MRVAAVAPWQINVTRILPAARIGRCMIYLSVATANILRKPRKAQAEATQKRSARAMPDVLSKIVTVRPVWRLTAACTLALAFLLAAQVKPAFAHHRSTQQALVAGGISIPSLTHGQMTVIAANKAEILRLAESQAHGDDVLKRLVNFVNIQFSFCLWGLVPGSLTDDASPFNECSHAYLAATRSLLAHLLETADSPAVEVLSAKIDREMLQNNASLTLCRYSDEPFNTAQVIIPHWSDAPFHLPTLLTFFSLLLMGTSLIGAVVLLGRRPYGVTLQQPGTRA